MAGRFGHEREGDDDQPGGSGAGQHHGAVEPLPAREQLLVQVVPDLGFDFACLAPTAAEPDAKELPKPGGRQPVRAGRVGILGHLGTTTLQALQGRRDRV